MTASLVIEGLGAALPSRIVSNEDIVERLGVTDEWVQRRTGIQQRRMVQPGVTTADLATTAGQNALKSASWEEVDAVVLATTTPDRLCPATAPEVAARLVSGYPLAFDIASVCSGFVYGLATCAGLVAAGIAERILLIGAETNSYFLQNSPASRGPAVIFGDGAGAIALRAGAGGAGTGAEARYGVVGPFDLGSDGSRSDLIRINTGGSRERARISVGNRPAQQTDPYMTMEGQEVYRQALAVMTRSSLRVLDRAGLTTHDVDRFVAHQANQRILTQVADKLQLSDDKQLGNVATVGNTGAASIPLALADACVNDRLWAGQRLLMTSFGGGLTWGSALAVWPAVRPILTDH